MKHLNAINKKAARVVAATEADVVALQQGRHAAAARGAAHPAGLLAGVLAGLGGRSRRRHRRAVLAGGARPVRLPHGLLLAGPRARSAQSRARLDGQVRRGPEGLAQDRPGVPGMRTPHAPVSLAGAAGGRRSPSSLRRAVVGPEQGRPRRRRSPAATARCTSAPTRARSRSTTRPPRRWWTRSRSRRGFRARSRRRRIARGSTRLNSRFEEIEVDRHRLAQDHRQLQAEQPATSTCGSTTCSRIRATSS